MPVRKFRSIEQMKSASKWLPPGDPAIGRKIRYLWGMVGTTLGPYLHTPRGVHKFRTIEEKNAFDDYYERERVASIRDRGKK